MAKRLLTECPYCHRRVSYIGAGILKTKGEHICKGCKCISNVVIHRLLYGIAGGSVIISLIILLLYSTYGKHDDIKGIIFVFLPFLVFYIVVPFFVKLEPCTDRSAVRKLHKKIDPLLVPESKQVKKQDIPVQPVELNVSEDFGKSFMLAKSSVKPVEEEEDKYDRIITETEKEDISSGLDIDITGIVKPDESEASVVTEASEILPEEDIPPKTEPVPPLDEPAEEAISDNTQGNEVSFIFGKINQNDTNN